MKELERQIRQYEGYILSQFRAGEMPLLLHEYYLAFGQIMSAYYCKRDGVARRSSELCAGHNQCGFGVRGNVSIDPLGDVYGCHHIKPLNHDSIFYLGNIYDGIDEGHVRRLVEMYDPQKVGNERCSECGLDWFCSGGCAGGSVFPWTWGRGAGGSIWQCCLPSSSTSFCGAWGRT